MNDLPHYGIVYAPAAAMIPRVTLLLAALFSGSIAANTNSTAPQFIADPDSIKNFTSENEARKWVEVHNIAAFQDASCKNETQVCEYKQYGVMHREGNNTDPLLWPVQPYSVKLSCRDTTDWTGTKEHEEMDSTGYDNMTKNYGAPEVDKAGT
ncbi:hypothetical protein O9K51_06478 [Purpureocillium lavendulum]|uniref:Uncharacterized protein n=1 Tax=Purpureocillium lavendulum TaxID=1247861 RepID=A0AB34FP72_9HYPO|nr:hypothetical protein O9K51_06478 [Purpureocillium lavendulum]